MRQLNQKQLLNLKIYYLDAQATDYKNGTFVIPHKDHYHYVELKWFDEEKDLLADSDKTYSLEDYY